MGNTFNMVAIWRNPSLRTPSYVLLAGLAFTEFRTGLLTQPSPFYVVYQLAKKAGNRDMLCIAGVVTERIGCYFSSLTVIGNNSWGNSASVSFITVRRVIIIYVTLVV